MASLSLSLLPKTLTPESHRKPSTPLIAPTFRLNLSSPFRSTSVPFSWTRPHSNRTSSRSPIRAAVDGDYSAKRSSSNEPRETIMLPGCDYNHWLIVMEFPKDPAPTREQMIETYLNTLATVLGR